MALLPIAERSQEQIPDMPASPPRVALVPESSPATAPTSSPTDVDVDLEHGDPFDDSRSFASSIIPEKPQPAMSKTTLRPRPSKASLASSKYSRRSRRSRRCWRPRFFDMLAGLPPRQLFWVKMLLVFLVLGTVVGIGLGISAAVGGGFYAGEHTIKPVITR